MSLGRKVYAVAEFVYANPGCTKFAAAVAVGPTTSAGYRAVDRAITNGYLAATRHGQKYSLLLTPAGLAMLGRGEQATYAAWVCTDYASLARDRADVMVVPVPDHAGASDPPVLHVELLCRYDAEDVEQHADAALESSGWHRTGEWEPADWGGTAPVEKI